MRVTWCPWGRWKSDPMKLQLGALWACGPDVSVCVSVRVCARVCLHVIASLLVHTCLPSASFVWNSWLPPSATPLHELLQNVYRLDVCVCVCVPCVDPFFFSIIPSTFRTIKNIMHKCNIKQLWEVILCTHKSKQNKTKKTCHVCSVAPFKQRNQTLIIGVSKTVNVLFFKSCTI